MKKNEIKERRRLQHLKHKDKENKQNAEYRKRTKEQGVSVIGWLIKKFEGDPCVDCNVVYPYHVMDWDHRPEETKEFNISQNGLNKATPERIATLMKEISKCDYVCANCHRVRTWYDRKDNECP